MRSAFGSQLLEHRFASRRRITLRLELVLRLGRRDIATGAKDNALDRLDPFAAAVEAGADLDGAEDGLRAGFGLVGVLDQELGGEAQVFAAALVEAGGARVAIDGAEIRELVIFLDQLDIAPGNEILFEVGAVGMIADDAFAGVMIERNLIGIIAPRGGSFGDGPVEHFRDVLGRITAGDDRGLTPRRGVALEFPSRLGRGGLPDWFTEREAGLGGVGRRGLGRGDLPDWFTQREAGLGVVGRRGLRRGDLPDWFTEREADLAGVWLRRLGRSVERCGGGGRILRREGCGGGGARRFRHGDGFRRSLCGDGRRSCEGARRFRRGDGFGRSLRGGDRRSWGDLGYLRLMPESLLGGLD